MTLQYEHPEDVFRALMSGHDPHCEHCEHIRQPISPWCAKRNKPPMENKCVEEATCKEFQYAPNNWHSI